MKRDVTATAQEAMRLKNDTAFQQFIQDVREQQKEVFATSGAKDIEVREEAHAIIRALEAIEINLDAAIGAERFLKERN
jgi:hypothetical protein